MKITKINGFKIFRVSTRKTGKLGAWSLLGRGIKKPFCTQRDAKSFAENYKA